MRLRVHRLSAAPDHVDEDVVEAARPRRDGPGLPQRLADRVVARDLDQALAALEIQAAVARVTDVELRPQHVPHGQGRARVELIDLLAERDLLEPRLALTERVPELLAELLLVFFVGRGHPRHRVERELGDHVDRHRAGHLSAPVPAHPVGDHQEGPLGARDAPLRLRHRERGVAHLEPAAEVGDQVGVLVVVAHAADVGLTRHVHRVRLGRLARRLPRTQHGERLVGEIWSVPLFRHQPPFPRLEHTLNRSPRRHPSGDGGPSSAVSITGVARRRPAVHHLARVRTSCRE